MSQENIETVRRLHELFNRRDVEGFLDLVHPDFEWIPLWAKLQGTVYRGHDELARAFEELDSDWLEFRADPHEFRDLGDVVLACGSWHGQARTSRLVVEGQPGAWVTLFRDGRAVRMETFSNRDDALEAAGLSE